MDDVHFCPVKKSGKSSLINLITQKCTDKRTSIWLFSSTYAIDPTLIEIIQSLEKKGNCVTCYDSLFDGKTNLLDDIMHEINQGEPKEEEKEEEEEENETIYELEMDEEESDEEEEEDELEFDNPEVPEAEEFEKAKRRIINGITQGASIRGAFAFYLFKEYLDDMDDTLVEKYNEILKLVFGIYDDENAIAMMLAALAQGQKMQGGESEIEYDKENKQFIIKAHALCFPMLVHEIVKGLYEIVGTEGFGSDKEKIKLLLMQ